MLVYNINPEIAATNGKSKYFCHQNEKKMNEDRMLDLCAAQLLMCTNTHFLSAGIHE